MSFSYSASFTAFRVFVFFLKYCSYSIWLFGYSVYEVQNIRIQIFSSSTIQLFHSKGTKYPNSVIQQLLFSWVIVFFLKVLFILNLTIQLFHSRGTKYPNSAIQQLLFSFLLNFDIQLLNLRFTKYPDSAIQQLLFRLATGFLKKLSVDLNFSS